MGAGFPCSEALTQQGQRWDGGCQQPQAGPSSIWGSTEPPDADPGIAIVFFVDFKEAERTMGSILENS